MATSSLHGWKLAVLRRRPGGGAEHWGHLFVLVDPLGVPSARSLSSSGLFGSAPLEGESREYPFHSVEGAGLVVARARTPGNLVQLARIAEALGVRTSNDASRA
jgi:hypothetical protein